MTVFFIRLWAYYNQYKQLWNKLLAISQWNHAPKARSPETDQKSSKRVSYVLYQFHLKKKAHNSNIQIMRFFLKLNWYEKCNKHSLSFFGLFQVNAPEDNCFQCWAKQQLMLGWPGFHVYRACALGVHRWLPDERWPL